MDLRDRDCDYSVSNTSESIAEHCVRRVDTITRVDSQGRASLEREYKALLRSHGLVSRFLPIPLHSYDRSAALSFKIGRQLQFVWEWLSANWGRRTALGPRDMFRLGRGDPMEELGNEVASSFQQLGRAIDVPVLVRTFPTGTFNAHVRVVSNGALILVNSALKALLHQVTKVIGLSTPQLNPKPHLSEEQLAEEFAKIVYAFLRFGDSREAARLPLLDERTAFFSTALLYEAERFVVSHEYAHLAAGHLGDRPKTKIRTSAGMLEVLSVSRRQEEEADLLACKALFNLREDHPMRILFKEIYPRFHACGPLLLFALDDLLTDVVVNCPHLFSLSDSLARAIAKHITADGDNVAALSEIAPLDRAPAHLRLKWCREHFANTCSPDDLHLADQIVSWIAGQTEIINTNFGGMSRLDARAWLRRRNF